MCVSAKEESDSLVNNAPLTDGRNGGAQQTVWEIFIDGDGKI